MIYFISGGVRSGKSYYAEQLARLLIKPNSSLHYLATSIPYDKEMKQRVKHHQIERDKQEFCWKTWEVPRFVDRIYPLFASEDVILLDCLTNLVSNELFYGWEKNLNYWKEQRYREQLFDRLMETILLIAKKPFPTVIVSNEVFQDIPTEDEGTSYFLQLLGSLHQRIVELSEQAILVESGLPLIKKG